MIPVAMKIPVIQFCLNLLDVLSKPEYINDLIYLRNITYIHNLMES